MVPRSLLGPVVRITAINAYRAALFAAKPDTHIEPHPFTHRKETIATITSRHRMMNGTYEKVLDNIFTMGKDYKPASIPTLNSLSDK